ncbi:hypothetical protein [Mesorhizobium sp. LNJC391B00]|uniref:hypothetical protein n=1 Tax=Mesorhizobium sp. LNJC391B00 TaxID=1287273 RepID=UPI0003CEDAF4|nr:hypothetical protein [Mesorhizobium sp. LNJC391B00]ESY17068.1 hypothetical protein X749_31420 [Mesorhizobium sp. LNJC391B00]
MNEVAWLVVAAVVMVVVLALVLRGRLQFLRVNVLGKAGIDAGSHQSTATADGAKVARNATISVETGGRASADNSEIGGNLDVSSGTRDKR